MVTTWIRYGKPDVSMTLDGSLAALVAITAGCDVVSVPGAFVIGALAGIVTVFLIEFIDQKLRIDDPVGAIAAHGGCGALGTLLTGLFSVQDGLFYTGEIRLFLVQLAGVVAMALFVFVAMTLVFRILQATIGLRVSAAEEINGLDFKEKRPGTGLRTGPQRRFGGLVASLEGRGSAGRGPRNPLGPGYPRFGHGQSPAGRRPCPV